MAYMEALAGGIRELDQAVELGPGIAGDGGIGLLLLPDLLPLVLDTGKIVLHCFYLTFYTKSLLTGRDAAVTGPGPR